MKKMVLLCVFLTGVNVLYSFTAIKKDNAIIEKTLFGKLPDGREVYQYTLANKSGAILKVLNFGATVTSLTMPDRNGKYEDVVLGYDSLKGYIHSTNYFGTIVGRYGNRIGKGQFTLEGKKYQLTVNDGVNHLHGGRIGFSKKLWTAKTVHNSAGPSLRLTYISQDGEEGYPGTVTLSVTYTLTDKNELRIVYEGTTDKTTIFNPTHHSYFNLSGSLNNTILDHLLTIEADSFTPIDKGLITTGKFMDVSNTPMDFRTPTAIGARINDQFEQLIFGKGYDHNWVIKNYTKGKVRKAAEVYEQKSGRLMTVYTDQPGLQFYSGNFLDGTAKGKGVSYQRQNRLMFRSSMLS